MPYIRVFVALLDESMIQAWKRQLGFVKVHPCMDHVGCGDDLTDDASF